MRRAEEFSRTAFSLFSFDNVMSHAKIKAIKALSIAIAVILAFAPLAAEKKPPAKPIDLNVANIKELEELPGIGAVTAQRIIDARQKSGKFHRVEDLLAIRGISTKRLEILRPYVTVSTPQPAAQKSGTPVKKPPTK
jgi:competence protein ComEA